MIMQVIVNEDPDNETFWGALGGQIEVTAEGDDDEAASKAATTDVKLMHIADDGNGGVKMNDVARNEKGQLTRDMLTTDDA